MLSIDDTGFSRIRRNVFISSSIFFFTTVYCWGISDLNIYGHTFQIKPWFVFLISLGFYLLTLYRYYTAMNEKNDNRIETLHEKYSDEHKSTIMYSKAMEKVQSVYNKPNYLPVRLFRTVIKPGGTDNLGEVWTYEYSIAKVDLLTKDIEIIGKDNIEYSFSMGDHAIVYENAKRKMRHRTTYFLDYNLPYFYALISLSFTVIYWIPWRLIIHSMK